MSQIPVLVIGNRTYSSWSLRGWLVMAMAGLDFAEEMIWLDMPDHKPAMQAATGGVGTVPTLRIGGRCIADSLAIAEYAAEMAPDAGLWPKDAMDRAQARSLAARMHSGFMNLRRGCPMNLSNRFPDFKPDEGVLADLEILQLAWTDCLSRSKGPFLFGDFGAVDAFFAPVAIRVYGFNLPLTPICMRYVDALLDHPLMQQWISAARLEPDMERPRTDRLASGAFIPGDWPILRDR
ncbi:MAG: glutathione S-transferase [Alphaproteobacteria bacterium]|nr:glutathione S-transferase [Alphaproteobacteria bacterium]